MQYLEWVLLGIALLTAFSAVIPHPRRHYWVAHPPGLNWAGIGCIAVLGLMSLRLPHKGHLMPQLYIMLGFICSWLAIALINRGERAFPALLLVVVIRGCLLFDWGGRIAVALLTYCSYLALQIMGMMRVTFWGISLGRPLPPILRRLPPEELRRVWFGLVFNSALLFALVLIFVLLLVGAVLAEHESRNRLVKAHRRLREYALQIENQATLEERNRIAREIHDSVGHYLTAQSIQLENTALFFDQDRSKAANHLAKARHLGQEALANIRTSVASLRSNPHQRSLSSSIEQLISDFKSNTNIEIDSQLNLPANLSNELKAALLRLIQEALTNITKHSQATKVNLCLQKSQQQILLSIQDNGCGFDPSHNTTGFGLQGMKERTAALQGEMSIKSKAGYGCQIDIAIPLTGDDYYRA
ncbi:MAG: sensor histidine kinase [Cyanobacteria bacterium P01_G01_bin.67]